MRMHFARCGLPFYCSRNYAWDRFDIWFLWLFRLEIERAWLDDRQYNPLYWLRVRMWRYRHPIWIRRRVGIRLDRLLIDFKLGVYWLSRDHVWGTRARLFVPFRRGRGK